MNKEAILSFVKKNALSLVCLLAAILAMAAVYYPLGGWISQLKSDVDTATTAWDQLSGFDSKQRKLPMSDPNAADPGSLTIFPNSAVITAGTAANAKWSEDSAKMLAELQQLNQNGHELLAGANELPGPPSDDTIFNFKRLYSLVLSTDPKISGLGNPNATPPIPANQTLQKANRLNLQNDVLNGGLPPTQDEIKKAGDDLWINVYKPQVILRDNQPMNEQEVRDRFNQDVATLPLRMKADCAKKHKVYVEKDAFTVSTATITQAAKPLLTDIWYAQMQLWIQQDLAGAIAEENAKPNKENAKSTNILDAPVKRLISMQVPPPPMYVFPPASAGVSGIANGPATGDEKTPIPSFYGVSVTGRYSNAMYDVVRFRLVIDVDATKVNEVIDALSQSRLISIMVQNQFALDAETESVKGYLYGPGATVRLQLDGEALYMRSWTKDLMPDRIKLAMGLGPAGQPIQPIAPTNPMYNPTGFQGYPGYPGHP